MRSVLQTIVTAAALVQHVAGLVSSRQSVTRRRFTAPKKLTLEMADDETDQQDADSTIGNGDPDGVPIFDTNMRPTFLGLEPVASSDDSEPPLQVTGPIVMLLSIYVTLSLFFGDGMPL